MLAVFDVYGTLLDLKALEEALNRRFGPAGPHLAELWEQARLKYSWVHTLAGSAPSFGQVSVDAAAWALERLGIVADPTELAGLLRTALAPYPEVAEALAALNECGIRCVVLSNGDPDALEAALAVAGIDAAFDRILSAREAGAFKPDPRVYRLVAETFGVAPAAVWFFSSNFWDVFGAKRFGFRVAWVRRRQEPADRLGIRPDAELTSLADAPALLASKDRGA